MDGHISIPIGWLIGALVGAGTIISTLAITVFKVMTDRLAVQDRRLEAQDKLHQSQNKIIQSLQKDIERMSSGCGAPSCTWAKR